MDAAAHEFQEPDRVFRNGSENNPVQVRTARLVPIILISLEDYPIVPDPFDELKGPRPDRISDEAGRVFHEGGRADDVGKVHAHIGQEGRFHPLQFEYNGVFVSGLNGTDSAVHLHGHPVLGRTVLSWNIPALALEFYVPVFHHPADGKHHGVGV